jgi:hypothetical protein
MGAQNGHPALKPIRRGRAIRVAVPSGLGIAQAPDSAGEPGVSVYRSDAVLDLPVFSSVITALV